MNDILSSTLVLCDLDNLLLGADGCLAPSAREVLRLFSSRGGKFTVFSQRSPRAVRELMGEVLPTAPALLCGGNLTYSFDNAGTKQLRSFASMGDDFVTRLPMDTGVGVALQMNDGTTRVLRMSGTLEKHLRRENTPYLLGRAEDICSADILRVLFYQDDESVPLLKIIDKAFGSGITHLRAERMAKDMVALAPGSVSGFAMLEAVCLPVMLPQESVLVLAGGHPMLELVRASARSVAAADAPPDVRDAAANITLTDCAGGAAAEVLYALVRRSEAAV